jgi:hypothetical protein
LESRFRAVQCYDDPTVGVVTDLTRSEEKLDLRPVYVVGDCHARRLPSVHEAHQSRSCTFQNDVETCCANSWAPWVHCNGSTLESLNQRLHLPHKHACQAWVVHTGVKRGQSVHHIVRHGCERQQGKGGRGVGVRLFFLVTSPQLCPPNSDHRSWARGETSCGGRGGLGFWEERRKIHILRR